MGAASNKGSGKKVPGRPFKKGQSGNPAGRPRALELVRPRLSEITPDLIERLITEATTEGEEWFEATKLLLSYAIGKPPQAPEDREAMAASSGLAVLSTQEIVNAVRAINETKGESDG